MNWATLKTARHSDSPATAAFVSSGWKNHEPKEKPLSFAKLVTSGISLQLQKS